MRTHLPTAGAAQAVRLASANMASLQRAIRAAHDSSAGLDRTIRAALIRTPRTRTKASTTKSPLAYDIIGSLLGNYLSYNIKQDSVVSSNGTNNNGAEYFSSSVFSRSSGQAASRLLEGLLRGQRIL